MDMQTSSAVTKEKSGELMRMDNVSSADISDHFAMPDSSSAKFGRAYGACRPENLVHQQAGKGPFFNNYRDYSWDAILIGQDYSQLSEFNITKHINNVIINYRSDYYQDFYNLDLTGSSILSSSTKSFLETYSNAEEFVHLDRVTDLYGAPTEISITFKAIKKLLPKEGFYPVQRTIQLAREFSGSYSEENPIIGFSGPEGELGEWEGPFTSSNPAKTGHWRTVLEPFYAPGIMYNTIKAGIAVDYPIIDQRTMDTDEFTRTTGSAGAPSTTHGPNPTMHCSASYASRMPFEAIIEPYAWSQKIIGSASVDISPYNAPNAEHLPKSVMRLYDMDPELIIDSTGTIQQSNGVYETHAHNFFAEVPNFFLENGLSVIKSKPESTWKFPGPLSSSADGVKKWEMEIFIEKPDMWFMHDGMGYFGHWPYVHHLPSYYGMYPWDTCRESAASVRPCTNNTIANGRQNKYNKASLRITFDPAAIFEKYPERLARGTFTLDDIINNSVVEYSNLRWEQFGGTETAKTGMSLTASVEVFNIVGTEAGKNQWAINTKFETPMYNFSKCDANPAFVAAGFANASCATASVPDMQYGGTYRGMWHQYAQIPSPNAYDLLRFGVQDAIPRQAATNVSRTGSLADACGFSVAPIELGKIAKSKLIYEGVVVIPFYTDQGTKEEKFFDIPVSTFEESYERASKGVIKTSIDDMIYKQAIGRYVLPPKYDFCRIRNKSKKPFVKPSDFLPANTPFAMYIFEFSHKLTQQDLSDIWQNVMPSIAQYAKKQDLNIQHPITNGEIFGPDMLKYNGLEEIPANVRWKIFRVKQRANNDYYQTVENYASGLPQNTKQNDFGANWPYDFFSLVELGKMDVELGFERNTQPSRGLKSGTAKKRKAPNRIELKAAVLKEIIKEERKISDSGVCRDRFALNYSEKGKCEYPHLEAAIPSYEMEHDLLCTDPDADNFNKRLPCTYSEEKLVNYGRPQLVNCQNGAINIGVGNIESSTLSMVDADPGQAETLKVDYELSPVSGWSFIETEQNFNGVDAQDINVTIGPISDEQVGNYYLSIQGTDEDGNKSAKCVMTIVVNGIDGAPGLLPDVGVTGTPPAEVPVRGRAALLPVELRPRTLTSPALPTGGAVQPQLVPTPGTNTVRIVGGTLEVAGTARPAAPTRIPTVITPAIAAGEILEPEDFEPELSPGLPLLEEGVAIAPPNSMPSKDQVFDKTTMEAIHSKQGLANNRASGMDRLFGHSGEHSMTLGSATAAALSTKAEAEKRAMQLGCAGSHQMPNGSFMPCRSHEEFVAAIGPGMFGSAAGADDNTGDGGY